MVSRIASGDSLPEPVIECPKHATRRTPHAAAKLAQPLSRWQRAWEGQAKSWTHWVIHSLPAGAIGWAAWPPPHNASGSGHSPGPWRLQALQVCWASMALHAVPRAGRTHFWPQRLKRPRRSSGRAVLPNKQRLQGNESKVHVASVVKTVCFAVDGRTSTETGGDALFEGPGATRASRPSAQSPTHPQRAGMRCSPP